MPETYLSAEFTYMQQLSVFPEKKLSDISPHSEKTSFLRSSHASLALCLCMYK